MKGKVFWFKEGREDEMKEEGWSWYSFNRIEIGRLITEEGAIVVSKTVGRW